MNRSAFILGLFLILASDAILLGRVALNRSGGPIQTMELTDRELPMMPRDQEDSSVSLRVTWRSFYTGPASAQFPLDRETTFDSEKLQSLGFNCGTPDSKSQLYRAPQRRLLYVALELREVASAESSGQSAPMPAGSQERSVAGKNRARSRLVVVDAARNFAQLRGKYPDARSHLIVQGIVAASTFHDPKTEKESGWVGRVTGILPPEIHVPLPYSRDLNRPEAEKGRLSDYTVTLLYGRNMEPWIGSIAMSPK